MIKKCLGETLNLVIFTDSLGSLMNLEKATMPITTTMFTEFFLLFQSFKKKAKMSLWSAHVGIPGNEQADALAKAATSKDTTDCWIPATIKDVKRIIDQNVLQQWQTRWKDKEEKHYKLVKKRVSLKCKFQCASRKKETLISKPRLRKSL